MMPPSKILIVDDNNSELNKSKTILKKYDSLQPYYLKSLEESVKFCRGNPDTKFIITDMFYPLGENITHAQELYRLVGRGLHNLYLDCFWSSPHKYDIEIRAYLDKLIDGTIEKNQTPSGIILGLYALQHDILPVFITSEGHHGVSLEPIFTLFRYRQIFAGAQLIEGIDKHTQRKYWSDACKSLPVKENTYDIGASIASFWGISKKENKHGIKNQDLDDIQRNIIVREKNRLNNIISDQENPVSEYIEDFLNISNNIEKYIV